MTDWTAAVVGHLCESKRSGLTFETAWNLAIQTYPPRRRDTGALEEVAPDGRQLRMNLRPREETLVGFFKRACEDAWHDRGANREKTEPRVRFFRVEIIREVDESAPARRAHGAGGRVRQAA